MLRDRSRDYDDTTRRPAEWWDAVGGDGPEPYATAAWTYFQTVEEVEETPDD